jgi:hypothetical protein
VSEEIKKITVCYESRKAGLDYPSCCEGKDCDEERKKFPLPLCEMIRIEGCDFWVDNFRRNNIKVFDTEPLCRTQDNAKYVLKVRAECSVMRDRWLKCYMDSMPEDVIKALDDHSLREPIEQLIKIIFDDAFYWQRSEKNEPVSKFD